MTGGHQKFLFKIFINCKFSIFCLHQARSKPRGNPSNWNFRRRLIHSRWHFKLVLLNFNQDSLNFNKISLCIDIATVFIQRVHRSLWFKICVHTSLTVRGSRCTFDEDAQNIGQNVKILGDFLEIERLARRFCLPNGLGFGNTQIRAPASTMESPLVYTLRLKVSLFVAELLLDREIVRLKANKICYL